MSKFNPSKILKDLGAAAKKHSPEILMFLGISGMFATVAVAVAATPKALKAIEEEKERQNYELLEEAEENGYEECQQIDKLKPLDVVKVSWKYYVPTFVIGGASTFCLIGATSINLRRNAALAAAYAISESTMKEYREKVIEEIGEKKEETVRNAIAQDRVDKLGEIDEEAIIETGYGNTLCMDAISGRLFRSDIDKIQRIVNDLNRQMRTDCYISLNEFYYAIGLPGIKSCVGDDIGWNIDRGYIDIDRKSTLYNGRTPCMVIDYKLEPRYDFR